MCRRPKHVKASDSQPTSATPLFSRMYSICSSTVAPGTTILMNCAWNSFWP